MEQPATHHPEITTLELSPVIQPETQHPECKQDAIPTFPECNPGSELVTICKHNGKRSVEPARCHNLQH